MPDGTDGAAAGLQVAHAAELVPTGPEQRRHLSPPGDGLGRVAPVPEGVAIARRRTDAVSTAVKPTASPSLYGQSMVSAVPARLLGSGSC